MKNISNVLTTYPTVGLLYKRAILVSVTALGLLSAGIAAQAQSKEIPNTTETVLGQIETEMATTPKPTRNFAPLFSDSMLGSAKSDSAPVNGKAFNLTSDKAPPINHPNIQQQRQTTTPQPTPQNSNSSSGATGYIPPTPRERFRRYVRNTIGPFALLRAGLSSGISQARDNPPEWGQGMEGYGKRFASSMGRIAIQETVDYGLSEALRVDDTFETSNKNGFFPRLRDALVQNITTRKRNGRRVISIPRFVSVYTAGIIPAVTWYPDRFRVPDGLRAGTVSLGLGFATNALREFVLRR